MGHNRGLIFLLKEMTKLSKFIEQNPHLSQQLYDVLAIKIWFFRSVFSEDKLNIDASEDSIIDVLFISGYTETDEERDESMRALNNFFNKVKGVQIKTSPSLYIGITKIYSSENDCKSEWKLTEPLGRGIQGIIYSTCCEAECNMSSTHVMKIENASTDARKADFIRESELSELLGNNGIGPTVVASYVGKYVGIIIMEKLTITLESLESRILELEDKDVAIRIVNIIKGKFLRVISKLHELGYVHGDIHEGNIMLKMDTSNLVENLSKGKYELRLIDFGMMEKNEGEMFDEMAFNVWHGKMKKRIMSEGEE
jgi:serine/threonine protein kinase